MALLICQDATGRRCWVCGSKIEIIEESGAYMALTGARDVLYVHLACAQSLGQQIFRDLGQLNDLGIVIEKEQYD